MALAKNGVPRLRFPRDEVTEKGREWPRPSSSSVTPSWYCSIQKDVTRKEHNTMDSTENSTFETLGREIGSSVIAELVADIFEGAQVNASAEELAAWMKDKLTDETTFDLLWTEIARVIDLIEDWALADLGEREAA